MGSVNEVAIVNEGANGRRVGQRGKGFANLRDDNITVVERCTLDYRHVRKTGTL